ncbi:hypothetical protein GCM10009820_36470 [Leifsonia soli]
MKTSDRIPWADVPAPLLHRIAALLGSHIDTVDEQTGGFSPGVAARVSTISGRRAFVKAAPHSLGAAASLYSREADVLSVLPSGTSAPALIGSAEADGWFALVSEEIDGSHAQPPSEEHLVAVLDLLAASPEANELPLPKLTESVDFTQWPILAAEYCDRLGRWELENASRLSDAAISALPLLTGTRLVHLDTRLDNILFNAGGQPHLVDWAWACIGQPWIDGLCLLLDARYHGFAGTDALTSHELFSGVDPTTVDGVLAGLAGMFRLGSFQPAPPRMGFLRAFQAAEANEATAWIRERHAKRVCS